MRGARSIHTIETPTLGDRSYLVHDGEVALVIDPQRDLDRVLDLAEQEGVRITHVFETHVHNDYVTGGLALARRTGAAYLLNAEDEVGFERTAVAAGEEVPVGEQLRVRAVPTPGHTFHHLSYVVESAEGPPAVFTGGSLLYGATGRPDLLGAAYTEQLARLQHRSARRLGELPPEATVHPTHGFGSFCSAGTQSDPQDASTIGRERSANPALTRDEDSFVREVLAGLDVYPAYYVHMAPANRAGPGAADLGLPRTVDAHELRRRLEAGEWLVDLRTRSAFAAGHLRGSLNFGADGQCATYLGWMIAWGTPVTLLGESRDQVAQGRRELARIGIDLVTACAVGEPDEWGPAGVQSYPRASFADLAAVLGGRDIALLDVRRASEHAASHIAGAANIPIHEVAARLVDAPDGEVWVHCASGYRASIAASFLAAAGRRVVLVDDAYDRARESGLPVID